MRSFVGCHRVKSLERSREPPAGSFCYRAGTVATLHPQRMGYLYRLCHRMPHRMRFWKFCAGTCEHRSIQQQDTPWSRVLVYCIEVPSLQLTAKSRIRRRPSLPTGFDAYGRRAQRVARHRRRLHWIVGHQPTVAATSTTLHDGYSDCENAVVITPRNLNRRQ